MTAEVKNAWNYTSKPPNVFMAWYYLSTEQINFNFGSATISFSRRTFCIGISH